MHAGGAAAAHERAAAEDNEEVERMSYVGEQEGRGLQRKHAVSAACGGQDNAGVDQRSAASCRACKAAA